MKRNLIVLMGLDGSGKTTQAELVSKWLNEKGTPAEVVWMRGESYLTLPILKIGKALLRAPKEAKRGDGVHAGGDYEKYVSSKQSLFKNRVLRAIWRALTVFDLYLSVRFAFLKLARSTRVIVLDRYVYDTFIDIESAFGGKGTELDRLLASRLLRLFPRPEKVILIEISPEEAMQRKDDIPSIRYLEERHGLYDRVARAVGAVRIDGTESIEEVNLRLTSEIRRTRRGSA
jgi:thymidylate kinase